MVLAPPGTPWGLKIPMKTTNKSMILAGWWHIRDCQNLPLGIYIRFVKTKKMSPPGLHLAYIYAKWRPGGDIFLVFTKRIYMPNGRFWQSRMCHQPARIIDLLVVFIGILRPQGVPGGARTIGFL